MMYHEVEVSLLRSRNENTVFFAIPEAANFKKYLTNPSRIIARLNRQVKQVSFFFVTMELKLKPTEILKLLNPYCAPYFLKYHH